MDLPPSELPLPDMDDLAPVSASRAPSPSPVPSSQLPTAPPSSTPDWTSNLAKARRHERLSKLLRATVGLAVLGGIGAAVYWVWPEDMEVDPAVQARFEPHMASYGEELPSGGGSDPYVVGRLLPIEQHREGPSDDDIQAARAYGGAPALTHLAWRVDSLYNSLPDELVARDPSEVGTLARVSCTRVEAGVYVWGDGGEHHFEEGGEYHLVASAADGAAAGHAYRRRCEIVLVDLAARRQIGRQSFLGGEPPETANLSVDPRSDAAATTDVNNRLGPLPRAAMLAFLSSLPRR